MDDFCFSSECVLTYISFAELMSRYIDFILVSKGQGIYAGNKKRPTRRKYFQPG
jgi:hypothetical protein